MKPTVSIVIPTYNRPGLAVTLAKQIRKFYPKIEIIIINQQSSSKIKLDEIKIYQIKYFNLDKINTSIAKNKGVLEATGDIVIFFDDDVEITKETVNEHIKAYKDKSVAGVAGRVINDGEKIPKNSAVETGKTNFFGLRFLQQFWSTKKQSVDFSYGCNMSYRRSAIIKTGMFDSKLSKIFEEIDLGVRVSKKVGKIIFIPEALVYHHKAPIGGIRQDEKTNKEQFLFKNYGYYLAKNVSFPFSLISLLVRTRTLLLKHPFALKDFYRSYLYYFFSKLNRFTILVLSAFSVIFFLRFWKVPELFNFTLSEEWMSLLAWEQVKNFHPIWIGVSAANIKYQYGPGFTYLTALFLYITKDPVILAYFSAIFGLITVFSLYYIVKDLFSKKTALFAAIFYGCSTLINWHDRRFWPPTLVPFITIWFIYSLIKAKKNTNWFILTSILVGIALHVHLSVLLLLFPALYSIIINFKRIKLKTWIIMIALYLTITSPMIVFDVVHNYDNFLMPYRVLVRKQKTELSGFNIGKTFDHVKETVSTLGRLWFIKLNTNPQDEIILESHKNMTKGNIILSLFSIIALGWFFLKNRKPGFQIFFIPLIIIPVSYILYPSYNPEYYLISFLTLMAVVIGYWLTSLPKTVSSILIILFIIANFLTMITASDKYGLTVKKNLIEKTMPAIGNKIFYLDMVGEIPQKYFPYAGWRYLFKAYGRTPSQSSAEILFWWVYPDEISKEKPELKVIISDTIQPKFETKPLYTFNSGIYYAYIFKND